MTVIATPPFPSYFDVNGSPLENGYLYFGIANQNPETNPITVYWDSGYTQPAAQPIRTSGGFAVRNGTPASVYVNSDFSITVRDKNSRLIYTKLTSDWAIDPNFDASGIPYSQAGTGAISTNVQAALRRYVNVLDFGVNTTPGVTDMATAFNNALAAVNATNGTVFCSGDFLIGSNVTVPDGVSVIGYPMANIKTNGAGNFIVTANNTIENIAFNWNSTARRVYGDNASSVTFCNCSSSNSTGNGFDLFNGPVDVSFTNCVAANNGGYGIAALGSTTQRPNRITVRGCKAFNNFLDGICVSGVGEKVSPPQSPLYARNIVISDCIANQNGFGNTAFNGITFPYAQYVTMSNCVTYANTEHGVALQESFDFSISNCVSYGNGQAGVSMQSGVAPNNPSSRGVVTGFNAYNNSNEGLALKEVCSNIIFSGCSFANNTQYSVRLRDLAASGLKSTDITFIGCAFEPSPGSGFVNSNASTGITSTSSVNFNGLPLQPNGMISQSLSTSITLETRGATLDYPELFILANSGADVSRTLIAQAFTGRRIILMANNSGAVAIRHNQGDGVTYAGFVLQAAATVTLGAYENITFVGNGTNWIQVAANT